MIGFVDCYIVRCMYWLLVVRVKCC